MTTPKKLRRITEIALVVNAIAHAVATVGMATGQLPHAAGEPFMARRAAAAGLAGVIMMLFVSRRLARDAALIALPIAFVFFNLTVSAIDLVVTRNSENLPPMAFEATFFVVYCAYAFVEYRASRLAPS